MFRAYNVPWGCCKPPSFIRGFMTALGLIDLLLEYHSDRIPGMGPPLFFIRCSTATIFPQFLFLNLCHKISLIKAYDKRHQPLLCETQIEFLQKTSPLYALALKV